MVRCLAERFVAELNLPVVAPYLLFLFFSFPFLWLVVVAVLCVSMVGDVVVVSVGLGGEGRRNRIHLRFLLFTNYVSLLLLGVFSFRLIFMYSHIVTLFTIHFRCF